MPIAGIYGPDDFGSPRRGQPATSARSRVASSSRPTSRSSTADRRRGPAGGPVLMLRSSEATISKTEQEGGQPFDG